jgi:threonine/homoserine/homoserine lactone efflux protein
MYFALSALGLGAVLLASYRVFTVLKYLGALYLIVLGIQTIRGAGLGLGDVDGAHETVSPTRTWLRATVLQLSNPKALIFFAALLPQFIDTAGPIPLQMLILAVTSVIVEFVVLAGYGVLAGRAGALARQPRFARITNRVSGAMLITAGAGIALTRAGLGRLLP